MTPQLVAFTLAGVLMFFGFASAWLQLRGRRDLAARTHVPSDERAYLRSRHRRRLIVAILLIVVGGMIGGAYLFGLEATADNLKAQQDADGVKQPMNDQEKNFVRLWTVYWIAVILLAGAIVAIGLLDANASRRYWLNLYRQLKDEHQAKLRRDLAVYRQQKDDRGARRGTL